MYKYSKFVLALFIAFSLVPIISNAQFRFQGIDITRDSSSTGISESKVVNSDISDNSKIPESVSGKSVKGNDSFGFIKRIIRNVIEKISGLRADITDVVADKILPDNTDLSSGGIAKYVHRRHKTIRRRHATTNRVAMPRANSKPLRTARRPAIDGQGIARYIKGKYGISVAVMRGGWWTKQHLLDANAVLASLPPYFRKSTSTIYRDGIRPGAEDGVGPRTAGFVKLPKSTLYAGKNLCSKNLTIGRKIHITNFGAHGDRDRYFKGAIVHEMAHTFQATHPGIYKVWLKSFNPGNSQTAYGRSEPLEDMAESVRLYWKGELKDRRRYNFILKYVMVGRRYR